MTIAVAAEQSNWQERAACKGLDTDIFFPTPGDEVAVKQAKSVCWGQCPVRNECLEFAYANEPVCDTTLDLGVYGGMTYDERRLLRRRNRDARLGRG